MADRHVSGLSEQFTVIRYAIGISGQVLELTAPVLKHLRNHRQRSWFQKEAGGQLFARFIGTRIVVEEATGPRRSDIRSRHSYIPDRRAEQSEIRSRHLRGLHYVGDWHTHPQNIPEPSAADESSIQDCVRKSSHNLNGFVLVIVGRSDPPQGLHVSVHNGLVSHSLIGE